MQQKKEHLTLYKAKEYPISLDVLDNMDEQSKQQIFLKEQLFEEIFQNFPYSQINEISKNSDSNVDIQYTYGEINFEPFAQVMFVLKQKFNELQQNGGVFYDLGCGTGKPLICALFMHQFDKVVGIEYLPEIYTELQKVGKVYEEKQQSIEKQLTEINNNGLQYKSPIIDLKQGNYFEMDWSDGDLVFVNSTCLDSDLMIKLAEHSNKLKKGSLLVCTTYEFPGDEKIWQNLTSFLRFFSWGSVTIHIYKKIQ